MKNNRVTVYMLGRSSLITLESNDYLSPLCAKLHQRPTVPKDDPITGVQAAIEAVQRCMKQHEGSFLQFHCDEKGFLSICAFGLPGKTHEDDPSRGIRAAIDIVNSLERMKEVGSTCISVLALHEDFCTHETASRCVLLAMQQS